MAPTVLDASALIAALIGEPARGEVERILRERPPPAIAAVNLGESIEWLLRIAGQPERVVRRQVNLLLVGGLQVEPMWVPTARLAAVLRARHYHRARAPISLADCACLATAQTLGASMATTDPDLAHVGRQIGLGVIALPDSQGRLP